MIEDFKSPRSYLESNSNLALERSNENTILMYWWTFNEAYTSTGQNDPGKTCNFHSILGIQMPQILVSWREETSEHLPFWS